jgi:hypothetical protein
MMPFFRQVEAPIKRTIGSKTKPKHRSRSFGCESQSNLLCRKPPRRHRSVLLLFALDLSLVGVCGRGGLRLRPLVWLPIRLLLDIVVSILWLCLCSIRRLPIRLLYVWRWCAPSSLVITQNYVQSMDYAWNVAEKAEDKVDDEVSATPAADGYCNRREQDCQDDDEDI